MFLTKNNKTCWQGLQFHPEFVHVIVGLVKMLKNSMGAKPLQQCLT